MTRRHEFFGRVLSTLVLTSCTSMRPLETSDPNALRAQLEPGDHVVVTTLDGRRYEGVVHALDEHGLSVDRTGAAPGGEGVEVQYGELATIAVSRTDTGPTVVTVLAVSALALFVLGSAAILLVYG